MKREEVRDLIKESEHFIDTIIKTKYLQEGEKDWNDLCNRFERVLKEDKNENWWNKDLPEKIPNLMKEKKYIPAGSVLYGFGLQKNNNISLSNCYYIPIEEDSIEGIYDFLKKQARTYSWRGGVGTDISILRPKGTKVNNAAKTSSGSVSFMPLLSESTNTIGQNGRRGAHLISIHDWHPDVIDFIRCKSEPDKVFDYDYINNHLPNVYYANISVKLSDKFFKAVENDEEWELIYPDIYADKEFYNKNWTGDIEDWIKKGGKIKLYGRIKAREILKLISESAWKSAEPGVLYWDNVMKYTPFAKIKGYEPKGMNPCIVGDTLVAVADGRNAVKIKDLAKENKEFLVYSGKFVQGHWKPEIKKAIAFKTGTKKILKIVLSDGSYFECTPDHLLALKDGGYVEAKDSKGKKLLKFNLNENEDVIVVDVIDEGKVEDVYDLTVEDNHNFYIITKTNDEKYLNSSGCLIHNCGEQILPNYGNCNLHAIVLYKYVENSWSNLAKFNLGELKKDLKYIYEFADYIVSINQHPLKEQNKMDEEMRKIGIEFTGLADALAMLGYEYGSEEAIDYLDKILKEITNYLWELNLELAKAKGKAPVFENEENLKNFLESEYFERANVKIVKEKRDEILKYGFRNTAILNNGPTGSVSIIADNCTSGIEPLFKISYVRNSRIVGKETTLIHLPLMKWLFENNIDDLDLSTDELKKKYHYVEAEELDYHQRIKMQAILQKYFTDSIASTINLPENITSEDIAKIYLEGWKEGLKGITIFRNNSITGVLNKVNEDKEEKEKEDIKQPKANGQFAFGDLYKKDLFNEEKAIRYIVKWKGIKVYIIVVYDELDGMPLEIFAQLPIEAGFGEDGIFHQELYMERLSYWHAISRLLSLAFRYSIPLDEIKKQLKKSAYAITYLPSILVRILNKYPLESAFDEEDEEIEITEDKYMKCPICGEMKLIREGGCEKCLNCGYSKCE